LTGEAREAKLLVVPATGPASPRILIVSNRAPVTVEVAAGGEWSIHRSAGGLATGLGGPHERSGGLWIGWPGRTADLDAGRRVALDRRLAELRVVPVDLTDEEVSGYYEGVSNEVIWPVFHSFLGQVPLQIPDFSVYEHVNQRFADAVAAHHRPGDLIWVHDYHLMLVPGLLRARIPDARIGFFLHIPFPPSEVFRTLPYRERLVEGLLGADLIGFHTPSYVRHFAAAVTRTLGIAAGVHGVLWQHGQHRLGVFPMGIDVAFFDAMAQDESVALEAAKMRSPAEAKVLVGIDRLDYTKGIPRRLLAFEKLLQEHPELHERVRLIQVAVPSRTAVEAYQDLRALVEGLVGQINGTFSTSAWSPIRYLFRSLTPPEVVALYRAADVMLVTPIRDGMNLVAKEFVASRRDEDGVLVLSELTGAASELAEAIHVNPYDVHGAAQAFHQALTMDEGERRLRMRGLRRRVMAYDVHRWAQSFLQELERSASTRAIGVATLTEPAVLRGVIARLRAARCLVLLLDYDGTLVPFAATPELAAPDRELLDLLAALAARPRTSVHIVSGRARETLERWLGGLPLGLHAEHGAWSRRPGEQAWSRLEVAAPRWLARVRAILHDFAARTPGALVEEKTLGLAWHYRMADPEYGSSQANELNLHLTSLLANEPVEVLQGDHVIEVRPYTVNKGRLVPLILGETAEDCAVLALGDDRTDQDLFAALPTGATAIHVGDKMSSAELRVADVGAVRALLRDLLG
jgi:trehalose 6-phosphate synthase/phosphatase